MAKIQVLAIFKKRNNLGNSIENKANLAEGQTEFQSAYSTDEARFNVQNVECETEVLETLEPLFNTVQAPALIAAANSPQIANRTNVYIANGKMFIVNS